MEFGEHQPEDQTHPHRGKLDQVGGPGTSMVTQDEEMEEFPHPLDVNSNHEGSGSVGSPGSGGGPGPGSRTGSAGSRSNRCQIKIGANSSATFAASNNPPPVATADTTFDGPSRLPRNGNGNSGFAVNRPLASTRVFGEVVLQLTNISKTFHVGKAEEIVIALSNINLNENEGSFPPIRKGEFVMIRGPSGGGKTTLLNVIGTLDAPTTGEVELLGKPVSKGSSDDYLSDLRLRHIGFVFQTFNLIATMSALENVELPMTLLGEMDEKARRQRAKQLLALVGLRNRAKHLPSELSGGEQQRVTIARALANSPSFLLLDEPTGDLDTQTTTEVMDLLVHINRMAGMTCLMVTHNPDVECYADRILYVSDGQFVEQVDNEEPFSLDYDSYQRFLNKRDAVSTTAQVFGSPQHR